MGSRRSNWEANALRLLKLPDYVVEELRAGVISAGHAKALHGEAPPLRPTPGESERQPPLLHIKEKTSERKSKSTKKESEGPQTEVRHGHS